MILKFEHRVNEGLLNKLFLNDVYINMDNNVYINMDNIFYFEVLRTRIKFYSTEKYFYWIPRTEYNIKKLNDYLNTLEK